MAAAPAFIPGFQSDVAFPLGRFFPPIPQGVVSTWLAENVPPGSWVIDPFCASPAVAVEAARAGYRVLAAANNPIERFLLELYCNPPSAAELRAALADLAVLPKGNERIEPYIRSLYSTQCQECGALITADAFIWERQGSAPVARIYTCPECKDSGERPAGAHDQQLAARFCARGLHWYRALERVAPMHDPDRAHAEDAMAVYLPRAVDALFTIINKLDGLTPERRWLVNALLLPVFDQANNLWQHPPLRSRPRQLSQLNRFREKNIWLALEEAIELWTSAFEARLPEGGRLPLVKFPLPPPEGGGITVYDGKLKDLQAELRAPDSRWGAGDMNTPSFQAAAMVTALPRPNQAYWTLSALWAGWLWGSEMTESFKSVLRRRRYDWGWHCTALSAAFEHLVSLLPQAGPAFAIIGESEPGYLAAALLAGAGTGLKLQGLAGRHQLSQAQIHWYNTNPGAVLADLAPSQYQEMLAQKGNLALQGYLKKRGEPAQFSQLHAVMLADILQAADFRLPQGLPVVDVLGQTQTTLLRTVQNNSSLAHLGGSERSAESGQWFASPAMLAELKPGEMAIPLADQVEMSVVRSLIAHPVYTAADLEQAVLQQYPGLLTPEQEIIHACLESYAEQVTVADKDTPARENADKKISWVLRDQDQPTSRRKDIQEIDDRLVKIGERLGYKVKHTQPATAGSRQALIWQDTNGQIEALFFILASAVMGGVNSQLEETLQKHKLEQPRLKALVVPGGRARLIHIKLQNNLALKNSVEAQWLFLKFRFVRRLAENDQITRAILYSQLAQDPLANSDPQIPLW